MKFFSAKFLITTIFALNASVAHANLFRIDLTFTDQDSPTTGTLTGFIVFDESEFDGTENRTTGNSINMPAWVSQASLTLSPTGGGSAVTQSNFTKIDWNVAVGVDFTAQTTLLPSQITRFGLRDDGDFNGSATSAPLIQQYDTGEFLLASTSSPPTPVPGPIPFLGLAPLAWYFKKFKEKSLKIKE